MKVTAEAKKETRIEIFYGNTDQIMTGCYELSDPNLISGGEKYEKMGNISDNSDFVYYDAVQSDTC